MASSEGGVALSEIQFEVYTPVSETQLGANVIQALALDLPELREFEYAFQDTIKIIANGPSAAQAPLDGKTLALNGALRLFTDRGLAPTYWCACDPQELVADFLPAEPPRSTTYLIASKCHPSVFKRLHGYNVIVWHVDDEPTYALVEDRFPVTAWVSVTLTAFELMARLGFRRFETWGWDGCFMDGAGHAVPQTEKDEAIRVEVGVEPFQSTHTWTLEAQSALQALAGFPFPVRVRGGGMIGAILKTYIPHRIVTDSPGSDSLAAAING